MTTIPQAIPARLDTLREIGNASITNSFQIIGTPFAHIVSMIKVINTCDTGMFFSFDGIDNQDYVPSNGFVLYDLVSNNLLLQMGAAVYIKYESAPSMGNVYVVGIYQRGS